MSRNFIAGSLLASLTFVLSASLLAQDFSANMMTTSKNGKNSVSKIYVSGGKARFEGGDEKRPGAAIIDFSQHTMTVVMPQQHMYMEMPMEQMAQNAMAYWRPDANDACPEWQRVAATMKEEKNHIATCHKIGNEVVNGRPAVKYEGTSTDGKTATVWIDPKLRFVSKVVDANGGFELRNIEEGMQPAILFTIPAGFQKFDASQMGGRQPH